MNCSGPASLSKPMTVLPQWASLVAQAVKDLPAVQEIWVRSLGWKDPLEKGMATHSSILAWEILRTEEPGGLQSIELQRVGHDWATKYVYISPLSDDCSTLWPGAKATSPAMSQQSSWMLLPWCCPCYSPGSGLVVLSADWLTALQSLS